MKLKSFLVVIVALITLSSCQLKPNEEAKLQIKVDSLVDLIKNNQAMAEILQEADALLDSIDANRNILHYRMSEGISYDDFSSRIRDIGSYIKRSEDKIKDLELALKTNRQSGSSYSARINDLKKSLEISNKEMSALKEQVANYRNENNNLVKTVDLQQAEIEDKLNQIKVREDEVSQLESRISEILIQSKVEEAEAYYARGEALELAAVRTTFLAPRKKKSTRQEALDMYRMAVLYGKDSAQIKVDELIKKL